MTTGGFRRRRPVARPPTSACSPAGFAQISRPGSGTPRPAGLSAGSMKMAGAKTTVSRFSTWRRSPAGWRAPSRPARSSIGSMAAGLSPATARREPTSTTGGSARDLPPAATSRPTSGPGEIPPRSPGGARSRTAGRCSASAISTCSRGSTWPGRTTPGSGSRRSSPGLPRCRRPVASGPTTPCRGGARSRGAAPPADWGSTVSSWRACSCRRRCSPGSWACGPRRPASRSRPGCPPTGRRSSSRASRCTATWSMCKPGGMAACW